MAVMLNAVLGYTTTVMAVKLYAALGVVWRPRRLAWVEVALFFVGRPEPVLGALGEAGPTPPSVAGSRDGGGLPKTVYLTGWAPVVRSDLVAALDLRFQPSVISTVRGVVDP